jgi:hypothetical protein
MALGAAGYLEIRHWDSCSFVFFTVYWGKEIQKLSPDSKFRIRLTS